MQKNGSRNERRNLFFSGKRGPKAKINFNGHDFFEFKLKLQIVETWKFLKKNLYVL